MRGRDSLLRLTAGLCLLLLAGAAEAALLTPSAVRTEPTSGAPTLTVTGPLTDLTDGSTATGVTVTSTPSSANPSTTYGFYIRVDYDISAYTSIIGFNATAQVAADFAGFLVPPAFRTGFGSLTTVGSFVATSVAVGAVAPVTINPTIGGTGFNELAGYISGDTLTISFVTEIDSGFADDGPSAPPLVMSIRELTLDLVTGPVIIPAPGSLPLLAGFLGLGALARRRARITSQP